VLFGGIVLVFLLNLAAIEIGDRAMSLWWIIWAMAAESVRKGFGIF